VAPSGESGGRNVERDFHGEKLTNDRRFSTTQPDAGLFRKGWKGGKALSHEQSDGLGNEAVDGGLNLLVQSYSSRDFLS
jgi:hypothetical protein